MGVKGLTGIAKKLRKYSADREEHCGVLNLTPQGKPSRPREEGR
jgi:hypothetical protein